MRIRPVIGGLAVCLLAHAPAALAQARLTLPEVIARARAEAPAVVSARAAIEESRAKLVGANLRVQSNPELAFGLGNRDSSLSRSTDLDVEISQMFEPSGRRSARIASATAAIERSTILVDEVSRVVVREAASAFYRALFADRRVALLTDAETVAASILTTADRRHRAGELAVIDVNLARAALARVRANREGAIADRLEAIGILKTLLRLDGEVEVDGALGPMSPVDVAALRSNAQSRPEVRELEAAIREADADIAVGRSFLRPDLGGGFRYSREGSDQIVAGSLRLTLPLFSTGQELRAAGSARAARLRTELDLTKRRIETELDVAVSIYNRRLVAVGLLEKEALPGLDENDTLATRSFDVGQIGLPDLLLIRRELLDLRFQYFDALLEAALARVSLDAAAGVLR